MTLVVYFDGGCPLCRREIALMRRLDRRGRIDFVDIAQSVPAACPIDRAELLERFHVDDSGTLRSGASAFAAMWRRIPLLWPLGQLARIPPFLWVMEQLYRAFLRIRPQIQRHLRRKDETRPR